MIGSKRWPIYSSLSVFGVSWLIAAMFVVSNKGFGAGDLSGFAFWSSLSAAASYPVFRLFSKWINLNSVSMYLLAILLALIHSIAWVYLVQFILGPWILAFSFPVFTCWLTGLTVGYLILVVEKNRSSWAYALMLAFVIPFATVFGIQKTERQPPPDLMLTLKPGISNEEEWQAQTIFHSPPTPTPKGYNPEGIRSISGADSGNESRFRVTFHSNSDREKRAAVIRKAVESPLIGKIIEYGDSSGIRIHRQLK